MLLKLFIKKEIYLIRSSLEYADFFQIKMYWETEVFLPLEPVILYLEIYSKSEIQTNISKSFLI